MTWTQEQSDASIKRLMQEIGQPDSRSIYQAFKQLENEIMQSSIVTTKQDPPAPPPIRVMQGFTWVNEWELVDWYTNAGKYYEVGDSYVEGLWFASIFKKDYQLKLEKSLKVNREMCKEWPH